MENVIKNRIIAISGEPVSGKGTTIKKMNDMLIKDGYKEENIHIISTGHQFRDYFEKTIEFIRNINDSEKLKKLGEDKGLKQILENKEYRKVLQNTISNIQKNNINLDDISKISELNNSEIFAELRSVVDTLIDGDTKRLGEEINSEERPDEVWIFDSRMAFDNIPGAFSVRLTVNPYEAAKRLYNDTSRGKEDRYASIEEAEKAREERRIGEIKRYKERYGVDLEDENNYNLIVDTTSAEVDDIAKIILECEERYRNGEGFGKNWASVLTMIPTQSFKDTLYPQLGSIWSLEKLEKEIKEHGYDPTEEVEIYKIDGINYLSEGHHRIISNLAAGNTLIPYIDLMKTEYGQDRTKKGNVPTFSINELYEYESMFESLLRRYKGNINMVFHYSDIYPNILEKAYNDKDWYK